MRVTYYALRPILVGEDTRQVGDLVPEAQDWPYLSGYLQDGKVAPVLVATLPEEQQVMLLEWEEEVYGPSAVSQAVNGPGEEEESEEDTTDEQAAEATDVKIDKRTKAYKDAVAQKTGA